jgi:hypothetical protein
MKTFRKLFFFIIANGMLAGNLPLHAQNLPTFFNSFCDYTTSLFTTTKAKITAACFATAGIFAWYRLNKKSPQTTARATSVIDKAKTNHLPRREKFVQQVAQKHVCMRQDFVEEWEKATRREKSMQHIAQRAQNTEKYSGVCLPETSVEPVALSGILQHLNQGQVGSRLISQSTASLNNENLNLHRDEEHKNGQDSAKSQHKNSVNNLFERCFLPGADIERQRYTVVNQLADINQKKSQKPAPKDENEEAEKPSELVQDDKDAAEAAKCHVSRRIIIRPEQPTRILLACVHGTGADANSFGGDDKKKLTQEIVTFGRHLAQHYDAGVEIMPFTWSGYLRSGSRKVAAIELANDLYTDITNPSSKVTYTHVWTIAHSHGCNVVNVMAHRLTTALQKIDLATPIRSVHIACPAADNQTDKVKYIENCYHFYGAHDATQMWGSIWDSYTNQRKVCSNNTTNICILEDDNNLRHTNINMPTVSNLPKLLFNIDKWYKPFTELIASTPHKKEKEEAEDGQPIICIKHCGQQRENYTNDTVERAVAYHTQQSTLFQRNFNITVGEPTPMHRRFGSVAKNTFLEATDKLRNTFFQPTP